MTNLPIKTYLSSWFNNFVTPIISKDPKKPTYITMWGLFECYKQTHHLTSLFSINNKQDLKLTFDSFQDYMTEVFIETDTITKPHELTNQSFQNSKELNMSEIVTYSHPTIDILNNVFESIKDDDRTQWLALYQIPPLIIEEEGLDKAGKTSAIQTIIHYYEKQGKTSTIISFPRYGTETGDTIQSWLFRKDAMGLSQKSFEILQAADKTLGQLKIKELIQTRQYDIIIIDRYILTQLAYGSYQNDILWLNSLTTEYIKPNLILYLNITPETSMARKGDIENDLYESDNALLEHVHQTYLTLLPTLNVPYVIIDAEQPLLTVSSQITDTLENLYGV